jgi:hypothetical protein
MSLTAAPDTVAPKIRSPKHMIQNRTKSSRAILYNLFIPVTHSFCLSQLQCMIVPIIILN